MQRTVLFSICLLLLAGVAARAEEEARSARIGLSPEAAKKAALETHVALYKSVLGGDMDARENWSLLKAPEQSAALAHLAWSKDDGAVRERAIRALARFSPSTDADGAALKALASVAVADGDGSLRALARKALTALGDNRAPLLLARALAINDALIHANTLEAMREIGGPRVFEIVIEHWKEFWGASARSHIFIGQQRSYIADYDISGNTYDPVVRSFMTGVVLDNKVLSVEADTWYVWIRELTGERNVPNDPAAWDRWVKKNAAELTKAAEKNKADAAAAFKIDE